MYKMIVLPITTISHILDYVGNNIGLISLKYTCRRFYYSILINIDVVITERQLFDKTNYYITHFFDNQYATYYLIKNIRDNSYENCEKLFKIPNVIFELCNKHELCDKHKSIKIIPKTIYICNDVIVECRNKNNIDISLLLSKNIKGCKLLHYLDINNINIEELLEKMLKTIYDKRYIFDDICVELKRINNIEKTISFYEIIKLHNIKYKLTQYTNTKYINIDTLLNAVLTSSNINYDELIQLLNHIPKKNRRKYFRKISSIYPKFILHNNYTFHYFLNNYKYNKNDSYTITKFLSLTNYEMKLICKYIWKNIIELKNDLYLYRLINFLKTYHCRHKKIYLTNILKEYT